MNKVELLKAAKEYITPIENWSEHGTGLPPKACAYKALEVAQPSPDTKLTQETGTFLRRAALNLFGSNYVSFINDGTLVSSPGFGKSDEERHQMILQIYEKAIELAEKE